MPDPMTAQTPLIALEGVSIIREGDTILSDMDWVVDPGSGWILSRANVSGKTTLLSGETEAHG